VITAQPMTSRMNLKIFMQIEIGSFLRRIRLGSSPLGSVSQDFYLRKAVSLHPVKATKQLQEKLEALMKVLDFKVRYEKGNFKSGYCIIEEQNVAVINKFFPMESKVGALIEILRTIEVDESKLDETQRKLLHKVQQTEITL
jgi:hypothetical protein